MATAYIMNNVYEKTKLHVRKGERDDDIVTISYALQGDHCDVRPTIPARRLPLIDSQVFPLSFTFGCGWRIL